MICFDLFELKQIFEDSQKASLYRRLLNTGVSIGELTAEKINSILDESVAELMMTKEDAEILIALDTCFQYFKDPKSKVCFVLKDGVQAKKISIKTLDDLKEVIQENTLTDFAIFSNGLRQFQLKRYTRELTTESFQKFLTDTLKKYGNDLGSVNLLVVLQGCGNADQIQENNINFKEIFEHLKKLQLNFTGEILVLNNEANKHQIITQLYPELKSMKKDLVLPSCGWN